MSRRAVLFVVALVLALTGTTGVLAYVSSVDARAGAAEEQFPVLVAAQLIPAGTTGSQAQADGLVELVEVPRRSVPAAALQDLAAMGDSVAAADIHPGEILLQPKFVSTEVAGSMEIPDDRVAVTIKVVDYQRINEFLRPGSEVAVFYTHEVHQPDGSPGDPVVKIATRLLLARTTVVAVGPAALRSVGGQAPPAEDGAAAAETDPASLVTLAVSIEEAQKLVHAAQHPPVTLSESNLYLGLLDGDSRTGTGWSDDNRTLFTDGTQS